MHAPYQRIVRQVTQLLHCLRCRACVMDSGRGSRGFEWFRGQCRASFKGHNNSLNLLSWYCLLGWWCSALAPLVRSLFGWGLITGISIIGGSKHLLVQPGFGYKFGALHLALESVYVFEEAQCNKSGYLPCVAWVLTQVHISKCFVGPQTWYEFFEKHSLRDLVVAQVKHPQILVTLDKLREWLNRQGWQLVVLQVNLLQADLTGKPLLTAKARHPNVLVSHFTLLSKNLVKNRGGYWILDRVVWEVYYLKGCTVNEARR